MSNPDQTPPLRLVYCGTPRFAVQPLEKLAGTGFKVGLVVTQPDRPRGRGLELTASPIKQAAIALGLPIAQPDKIKNNDAFRAQLAALKPDAIIVVGYGRIIPQWMLDLPLLGNINLHASLLPQYRGAAPIQWAIASGETVTGVTTMRIDAGLDSGDILLQQELAISPEDTAETLAPKLSAIGADLMVNTLRGLQDNSIRPHPQDNAAATLAPILKKEDGRIDFTQPAAQILNRLRGFQPWPGAHTRFRSKTLQVLRASIAEMSPSPAQGTLLALNDRLVAGCGANTALELIDVQLEGKKRAAARDFLHGYHLQSGEKLG
jgi:methionyl-tRNA formyltransferase